MKFISNQKLLSSKINIAQRAINIKSANDLLKGLKISAKDGSVKITAYDAEISIETEIESDISEEGEIVVNSRLFGDIIRKLPDSFVSIEVDGDNNIHISCANSNFKIKGQDASKFPEIPRPKDTRGYIFKQNILKSMIRQTVFSISQDPTKPILMGELFEIKDNKIILAAIDGYRLSVKRELLQGDFDNLKAIIPGKSLQDINALLEDDGDVEIKFGEKNVFFYLAGTFVSARLIEGEFIDYNRLLPRENTTKIKVNRKDLLESIERASILFQSEKNNLVKLQITDGLLQIKSNSDFGQVDDKIGIDLEGNELEIAFNSRYILEGIKYIDDEEIYMNFTTNVNPCVINPIDSDDYTYLLLPVRLN